MQRRVREEEPDERIVRRDAPAASAQPSRRSQQNDRALRREQRSRFSSVGEFRDRLCLVESRHHHGERLFLPPLARRRRATAAGYVASQARWNPPRPLIATISPAQERLRRAGDRVRPAERVALARKSADERRSTRRACIRLRMETPIRRVSYSRRQGSHISKDAIVVSRRSYGTPLCDREAGAAVRAVGERVPIAPVRGIEDLREAFASTSRDRAGSTLSGRRCRRLATMTKSSRRSGGMVRHESSRISAAAGGESRGSRAGNSRARPSPRTPRSSRRANRSRRGRRFRSHARAARSTAGTRRPAPFRGPRCSRPDSVMLRR